jgi:hypothetical protein
MSNERHPVSPDSQSVEGACHFCNVNMTLFFNRKDGLGQVHFGFRVPKNLTAVRLAVMLETKGCKVAADRIELSIVSYTGVLLLAAVRKLLR